MGIFYPVMTLVTVLIAIPSYFEPSAFALVMRDPTLSDAEEKLFRRLGRKERIERLGRWARKLVGGHTRSE